MVSKSASVLPKSAKSASHGKKTDNSLGVERGSHTPSSVPPRYLQKYLSSVLPSLLKKNPAKNVMQMPKIVKIVVSTCQGEATQNPKILESGVAELERITGQKALLARSKKSISNFKLRAGIPIGASVTLRRARMYEFYDKLVTVALPRIRDFRGVPGGGFDGNGNFSLGIREHIIFPEVEADKSERTFGLSVSIVTSTKSDELARELLSLMDMPFRK